MSHKEISFLLVTNCTQPRKQSGTSTLRYNIKGNRRCKQIQSLRKLARRLIQRRNENVSDKYKMRKLRRQRKIQTAFFLIWTKRTLYSFLVWKISYISKYFSSGQEQPYTWSETQGEREKGEDQNSPREAAQWRRGWRTFFRLGEARQITSYGVRLKKVEFTRFKVD